MISSVQPLKIAVIGAGFIGRRHIDYILEEPRCLLAGIVDTDTRLKNLADEAGTAYYPDIDTFLKNSDAIIIWIGNFNTK